MNVITHKDIEIIENRYITNYNEYKETPTLDLQEDLEADAAFLVTYSAYRKCKTYKDLYETILSLQSKKGK